MSIDEATARAATIDRAGKERGGDRSGPAQGQDPTGHLVDLPESLGYRVKTRLLGAPLRTEDLEHERLGRPTALAVFASDCISSSAYATEEILRVLISAVGIFAFSLVLPVTGAILVVLVFLILSYRETIKEYPTAGGAYMVTRDNFGIMPAQVAGVSLLTDYVLTVAVSTAAGTAALASFFPALTPWSTVIAISFTVLIAFGNLKGVKESGKIFAVPTYFFVVIMFVMLVVGLLRALHGDLHQQSIHGHAGAIPIGHGGIGDAFLYGAGVYVVAHAFASGGAAVTGVEAISNGVTAFRKPEWRNARSTLVIMGALLGTLFFGLSWLSTRIHPVPYESGVPTVISQVGKQVFGQSSFGNALYAMLQVGTVLILVMAANTSFADFPRLASFHAGDNFMPKQLTKRGHRLGFSNGIIFLAVCAIVLLAVTGAKVDRLIPLYAIGVFTSFTLSQAGMAKHHVTRREPGWRKGLFINGVGAVLSGVVATIILITKFTHGAWVIVVLVPVLVFALARLNRQYSAEAEELERDVAAAAGVATMRRHVVLVFVDSLDVASARALQYARTLGADEVRAVHLHLDPIRTEDLVAAWERLGYQRFPLDIVECPDRRIDRQATEIVARELRDRETEVTVLLPRREYLHSWQRLFHDGTANAIAKPLTHLAHCNVTVVPYHMGPEHTVAELVEAPRRGRRPSAKPQRTIDLGDMELPAERTRISDLTARQRARVVGRVYGVRVQTRAGAPMFEVTVIDDSGSIAAVFLGRRRIAGLDAGAQVAMEGMVATRGGRLVLNSPTYEILAPAPSHH
ncbi:MAG: amino acid permease [Actinobacteria bacterium]|nr:amino acid permease [Actinomycetota bacterium]